MSKTIDFADWPIAGGSRRTLQPFSMRKPGQFRPGPPTTRSWKRVPDITQDAADSRKKVERLTVLDDGCYRVCIYNVST